MSRNFKIKGPFFKKNLIESNQKKIKIIKKSLVILPEYINLIAFIYNGTRFIKVNINDSMVGYKFGEFIHTRKACVRKKKKK
jgi:ribosomal protein S19